ncbi:hypothetical protein B0H10DRAFT_2043372, partial [Mycena sp. CBHHK59/15]
APIEIRRHTSIRILLIAPCLLSGAVLYCQGFREKMSRCADWAVDCMTDLRAIPRRRGNYISGIPERPALSAGAQLHAPSLAGVENQGT